MDATPDCFSLTRLTDDLVCELIRARHAPRNYGNDRRIRRAAIKRFYETLEARGWTKRAICTAIENATAIGALQLASDLGQ